MSVAYPAFDALQSNTLPSSGKHHAEAYLALARSMVNEEPLARREQLDRWLLAHGYDMQQGVMWELERSSCTNAGEFWQQEYRRTTDNAYQAGLFYSDAFQKRLYHRFIENDRVLLSEAQRIQQQQQVSRHQESQSNRENSAVRLLSVSSLLVVTALLLAPLLLI